MRGGDLGNRTSYTLAFHLETLVDYQVKKGWIFDTVELILKEDAVRYLNNIWRRYDFNIYIFGVHDDIKEIEELLKPLSYSRLFIFDTEDEMVKALRREYITYYFDDNVDRGLKISVILPYAKRLTFDELRLLF